MNDLQREKKHVITRCDICLLTEEAYTTAGERSLVSSRLTGLLHYYKITWY